MPTYLRVMGSYSLGEGEEAEHEIECPACKVHYCPRDPITGGLELRKGQMYDVECPRCGHRVIVRQLAETLDDEADA